MRNEPLAAPSRHHADMADDEIDLKELFGALWRRKGLILLTTVVVAALAWVFAYFAQNVYQTYATVEIAAERKAAGNMANMDMVALAMGGASGSSLSNEVEIPDLVCMDYPAAEFLLSTANLNIGLVTEDETVTDPSIAYVAKQDPPFVPGVMVPMGTQVQLWLTQFPPEDCIYGPLYKRFVKELEKRNIMVLEETTKG